jgi:hypothetical protein
MSLMFMRSGVLTFQTVAALVELAPALTDPDRNLACFAQCNRMTETAPTCRLRGRTSLHLSQISNPAQHAPSLCDVEHIRPAAIASDPADRTTCSIWAQPVHQSTGRRMKRLLAKRSGWWPDCQRCQGGCIQHYMCACARARNRRAEVVLTTPVRH